MNSLVSLLEMLFCEVLDPFASVWALYSGVHMDSFLPIRIDLIKRRIPALKELLTEAEVADFFRFVQREGLHREASELLDEKLMKPAVVFFCSKKVVSHPDDT